jgi:hypothetical protein
MRSLQGFLQCRGKVSQSLAVGAVCAEEDFSLIGYEDDHRNLANVPARNFIRGVVEVDGDKPHFLGVLSREFLENRLYSMARLAPSGREKQNRQVENRMMRCGRGD